MKVVTHQTFKDNRGSYTAFPTNLENTQWDQCSISINKERYTFRGLHFQTNPAQTKYIKVVQGAIIDFLVDLHSRVVTINSGGVRTTSNFTVNHVKLTEDNDKGVFVPSNYAHGFLTLEPNTIVTYLVQGEYAPKYERSLVWNTIPEVRDVVETYTNNPILSEKDRVGK